MFEFDLETTLEEMEDLSFQEKIKQYIDFYIDSNYESIKDLAIKIDKLYKEKLSKIN